MTLKINILLVLSFLFVTTNSFSEDKFLRIKGTTVDSETKDAIGDFKIKIVDEDGGIESMSFKKSSFDFYLRDNRIFKLYFVKKGYERLYITVSTISMPSYAYSKKQKVEFKAKLKKGESSDEVDVKYSHMSIGYEKKMNQFELKDKTTKKRYVAPADYEAPFSSPADTYKQVKPALKNLLLTTEYNRKTAVGEVGMARALQGVLFADLNYCFFNEHTNDGNKILENLKLYDAQTWGSINPIDSPEYGIIIARTINREQSVDTIFALGAYIETTRLILQSFTSDSKVLVHLKKLPIVLESFKYSGNSQEEGDFIAHLAQLIEPINTLEHTYKDLLRTKMNFEMVEDSTFLNIKDKINEIHLTLIQ